MSERRKVLEAFEAQKDFMNEKVSYGIEHYRKGDAKITVVGKDGKAIRRLSRTLSTDIGEAPLWLALSLTT